MDSWTVDKLRRQKLGRQRIAGQDGVFTEQGQVQMQEPKSKTAMEAKERP